MRVSVFFLAVLMLSNGGCMDAQNGPTLETTLHLECKALNAALKEKEKKSGQRIEDFVTFLSTNTILIQGLPVLLDFDNLSDSELIVLFLGGQNVHFVDGNGATAYFQFRNSGNWPKLMDMDNDGWREYWIDQTRIATLGKGGLIEIRSCKE